MRRKAIYRAVLCQLESSFPDLGSIEKRLLWFGVIFYYISLPDRGKRVDLPEEPFRMEVLLWIYGLSIGGVGALFLYGFLFLKGFSWEGAIISTGLSVALFYLPKQKYKTALVNKERSINRDFPEILETFILLLEAGYSTAMIWRFFSTMDLNKNETEKEIKILSGKFQNGMSEEEIYRRLPTGLNCHIVEKFSSLCRSNLKAGSVDLARELRSLSHESWMNRRWAAIKLGEEASGKMVLPLMLVFCGVLIIIMVPALIQLARI